MRAHHAMCCVEYHSIDRSILTLLIPSSIRIHWNIPSAVSVRVGCNKKRIVIVDTITFLLKSVNHLGKTRCNIIKAATIPRKSKIGRSAVKNALRKAFEGVNSTI